MKPSSEGTCSPILANIFAHHVIDTWFEEQVKPRCAGQVTLYRFADDMVICCQYERDARRILRALEKRLEKYHLKLNAAKIRLVPFAKPAFQRQRQPTSFDFLGFTFYMGTLAERRRDPEAEK